MIVIMILKAKIIVINDYESIKTSTVRGRRGFVQCGHFSDKGERGS